GATPTTRSTPAAAPMPPPKTATGPIRNAGGRSGKCGRPPSTCSPATTCAWAITALKARTAVRGDWFPNACYWAGRWWFTTRSVEQDGSDNKMITGETAIRVRYAETDRMGLLHHANYLVYFEQARTELLRSLGVTYRDLEDQGYLLVLTKVEVRYK